MKGKFILIAAILLSLLNQSYSQFEHIEGIIQMSANFKKAFDEGQKIMSDFTESETLKNFQSEMILYRKQITDQKWDWFSNGESEQTEATEKKLQKCL